MSGIPSWWPFPCAVLVTAAAVGAGWSRGLPLGELFRPAAGVFLLLSCFFALSDARLRYLLATWCRSSPPRVFLLATGLVLPYLAYSIPLDRFSPSGLLALLAYLYLPLLVLLPRVKRGESAVADFTALLLVWLPLEFGWLPALWPWPPGQRGHFLDGLLGVVLAVLCFQVVRALPGIGFTLVPQARDWLLAGSGFLLFLPLAFGVGTLTGFLRISPHPLNPLASLVRMLGIFLVSAVPEELLFRGLLQNLLLRWTGRPFLSLGLASLIFGAAHLNVGTHPDWRLCLLATLAGGVYGWLYRAGEGLMAPALAHTFVNSFWTLLFRS